MKKNNLVIFLLSFLLMSCGFDFPWSKPREKKPEKDIQKTKVEVKDKEHEEPAALPDDAVKVTVWENGKERETIKSKAQKANYSIIDLSNYWVPFIFSERDKAEDERKPNRFRRVYQKLANDWHYESKTLSAAKEIVDTKRKRVRQYRALQLMDAGISISDIRQRLGLSDTEMDSDGHIIQAEKIAADAGVEFELEGTGDAANYLEVFGISPAFSVLKKRALNELEFKCYNEIDYEKIKRYKGFVAYISNERAESDAKRGLSFSRKMRRAMESAKVTDPLLLSQNPEHKMSNGLMKIALRYEALEEAQKLLVCEKMYEEKYETNYVKGGLDWKTHKALSKFEKKNRIFGWGFFGNETLDFLKKTRKERLFETFSRVLAERIIDSLHIIEDGSTSILNKEPVTYTNLDGKKKPVENLVAKMTALTLREMGIGTPDDVIKFLKSTDDDKFETMRIAVKLPKLPDYYSGEMELMAVIDRGDVWYDYPYTDDGKKRNQRRKVLPTLTLFVKWNNQEIPLVKMNTTIGSWRSEQAPDGYQYYKYKNSDVGTKVYREIIAGPVWLPPDTTPPEDLLKTIKYRGRKIKVPNYDEFGPWYASAYGLVAGFHVRPVTRRSGNIDYLDNGIRSHGSVDYNSILRRFSHGCHRLYNHMAIRYFDFILRHSKYERNGQTEARYSNEFTVKNDADDADGEKYVINIDTKGYKYTLENPVEIKVLPGRIRGLAKTPIEHYMPKPGVEYGEDAEFLPEEYKKKPVDAGAPDASVSGKTKSD